MEPLAYPPNSAAEPHYTGAAEGGLEPIARAPLHVVLDNLRSAYNVGSIFRTADAGALAHLHLCGMTAHPPHRKLEKTALGAFDYVPWAYYERVTDCVAALQGGGVPVIAAEVVEGASPLPDFEWPQPAALVIGNEVLGVQRRILDRADAVVQIPMHGYKNSINVATAFGILMYAALAQWQRV